MHLRRSFALAATAVFLFTACGDDDDAADTDDTTTTTEAEADEETTTTAADDGEATDGVNPEFADYCAAVAELDQQEEFASAEQLEEVRELAPEEIADEINTAVDILLAGIEAGNPEAAFDDPALQEAFGPIEAFEAENCGPTQQEG